MSLEMDDIEIDPQLEYLQQLGKIPVLIRFCHHEGPELWEKTARVIDQLVDSGHEVMVAVLQDRQAVLNSDSWENFLEFIFEEVGEKVSLIEVCHAVNRMKWGVHSAKEQGQLLEPLVPLQKKYPKARVSGPACIDFEYHYILSALDETPEGLHYAALLVWWKSALF